MSDASSVVVSCWFRLSEVGLWEFRKPQVAGSIPVAGSSTFLVFLFPADGSSKVATILKSWLFKGASSGSELTHRRSPLCFVGIESSPGGTPTRLSVKASGYPRRFL